MHARARHDITLEREILEVSNLDKRSPVFAFADVFATRRSFDLTMGANFASCERGIDEWKALVTAVDSRFVFQGVNGSKDSALSIIEFVWARE